MSYYSTSNNNASYGETPISPPYATITGRKNNYTCNNTNGSLMSGITSSFSTNNRKIKRSNIYGGRKKNSIATTATTNHTLTTMSP